MIGLTRDRLLVALYVALYGLTLLALHIFEHFAPGEALIVLVVLGGVLPALAWWLTRHSECLHLTAHRPAREAALLVAYLVVVSFVLVFGFDAVHRIEVEPLHSLSLLAVKLATFVVLPVVLLIEGGGCSAGELFPFSLRGRSLLPALWMSLAILAMQAVAGRGLRDLQAARLPASTLLLAAPLSFAWLLLEVGLVEEFFFRALLQERLASVLGSRWGGLVAGALLFGLVHAPGFYLRPARTMELLGDHPSLLMAVGYAVVMTSVAGLLMGMLWMRTKNLAVVILVHAAGDWLQGVVPFVTAFHLPR